MKRLLYIGFLAVLAAALSCSNSEPVVELAFGSIRGTFEDSFYSFHNIPYADPPVGDLRFKPPKPNNTWNGELDGTGPVKTCVQFGRYILYTGDEDCLYLHIVTPEINCKKTFAVRIQIHGGGFMIGSGDDFDTSILVKRGMIVVTMGYRLGPLGFLSTGDDTIPGNNGLKDQRLAIKWVKENIHHFCGDPNKIILAGVSAGGASVHMHMLDSSIERYVNGIIAHNGVATCPWAFDNNPQKTFKKFAKQIKCPIDADTLEMCLQSKSIDELREATISLQYYKGNPFTVFSAVAEPSYVDDPYLTEHPAEIMESGRTANVTFLVAYTEREGTSNAANFMSFNENGDAEINILNERWLELAPIMLFFENSKNHEEGIEYATFLKDKYLGEKKFSEKSYRLLEDMYTDILFTNDIKRTIDLHRKNNPGKVYVYLYKYPHNFTLGNLFSGRRDVSFGADHMADSILTIPMKILKQQMWTERENKLSDLLIDLLLNWANTGTVSFGGIELPAKEGQLVINEKCYSIENGKGESTLDCHGYD